MKRLLLTIALAVGAFASLAPSAQAWCHPYYRCGFRHEYRCGHYGYWYWNHGCRFWRVVVVPGPVFCP